MVSKRILLTGATGYIGTAVAEALARAGRSVVGLARSAEAAKRLRSLGHEAVEGDVRDADVVEAAARRVDAVIHLANTNDADAPAAEAAFRKAAHAALRQTGKPYVHTTGAWSLGDTGDGTADESSSTLHPLPLVAWRVPVEHEVLAWSADGIRSVVLRPGIAYGRAGGIPAMLAREARETGQVRVAGGGRNEWPVVHVDDLADLYVRALDAPAGTILHGVASPSYRYRDIALAASLGQGAGGRLADWPLGDARKELGPFADALALHERVGSAATRRLTGWSPAGPSIVEDLAVGSYARR